jgi:hypothetical protein
MSHDAAMELTTAGAVLGDLGPEERLSYAAHRRWCLDCRRLERDLDEVLADVALAARPREVPSGLLASVLGEIRGESAAATGPMAAPADAAARVSSTAVAGAGRLPFLGALALAAGLAIAVVGLGARDVARQQQLAAADATVASLESELAGRDGAMTVAMDPGRVAVALHPEAVAPGARAAVVYLPGTRAAWIVARDLPATPAGSAYQLWFADGAGVHPLEMVPFDGHGPFIAPIDVDLGGAAAVMITLERSTGAQGEPGPQVVFGEL